MNVQKQKWQPWAWTLSGISTLGLMFARTLSPDSLTFTAIFGVLILVGLGWLLILNQHSLRSRSASFGFSSLVTTLLVLGIVGVVNFLGARFPKKWDVTTNKLHTLNEQTEHLVRGLKSPVKVLHFGSIGDRDQYRMFFDNYKALSTYFEYEFLNLDRETLRAEQMGIRKYGNNVILEYQGREGRIEEITEERLTNALMKLLKDKTSEICTITGHGERSFESEDANGLGQIKKALEQQSYNLREISLLEHKQIPESCESVIIASPTKAFFEPEIQALDQYLERGGRMAVTLDIDVKGLELSPELNHLLMKWQIEPQKALIVDPVAQFLNLDATVSVVASFSTDHAITKEFRARSGATNCAFPLARPLKMLSKDDSGLKVSWIGESSPKSFAVNDFNALKTGVVRQGNDPNLAGPLKTVVAVEGKKKGTEAKVDTRLVVFGSGQFTTNQFVRFAHNMDLFVNSISWLMEDESFISIRAKEETAGRLDLNGQSARLIFLVTVVLLPIGSGLAGFLVWLIRRRR